MLALGGDVPAPPVIAAAHPGRRRIRRWLGVATGAAAGAARPPRALGKPYPPAA
ncbi:MAG: hypothetical protein JO139_07720 [Alphaproteobacteria bacterium]|nr:hypothetical protein [Alphaproteobacteria bacterium]